LELADGQLRELANPAFNSVRAAIADELVSLGAIALPDYEGLAFSLISLADRAPELPVVGGSADNYVSDQPALDNVEPGIGRLWETVKQAVLGIVRIERRNAPVQLLLSAAEERVTRREFVLELQLARVALLMRQPEAFRGSLIAAEAILRRDFRAEAAGVAGAIELLVAMRGLDIAPEPPNITRSLNLLRATPGGRD
jgi:uroporphyrin-3 C-methyltransferase